MAITLALDLAAAVKAPLRRVDGFVRKMFPILVTVGTAVCQFCDS